MPKPVPANKDKMNLYASLPNTGAPAGMKMSRSDVPGLPPLRMVRRRMSFFTVLSGNPKDVMYIL